MGFCIYGKIYILNTLNFNKMRTILILLISFSMLNIISAQENGDSVFEKKQKQKEINTLFGDEYVSNGGYGAFTIGYSEIENLDAIIIGGRGAWIIGHWFALGLAGTGFINDVHNNSQLNQDVNLSGGYGGLLMEPIILPWFPVHISVPVLFGAGGIAYVTGYESDDGNEPPVYVEDATSFVIFEPGAEVEFNIVRFFRLSAGVSYRFTSVINLYDTSTFPLNGWAGNVTLKFGRF
jgi:hypothetical protein